MTITTSPSLLALRRLSADRLGVAWYLVLGGDPHGQTALENVSRITPGTWSEFTTRESSAERCGVLMSPGPESSAPGGKAGDEVQPSKPNRENWSVDFFRSAPGWSSSPARGIVVSGAGDDAIRDLDFSGRQPSDDIALSTATIAAVREGGSPLASPLVLPLRRLREAATSASAQLRFGAYTGADTRRALLSSYVGNSLPSPVLRDGARGRHRGRRPGTHNSGKATWWTRWRLAALTGADPLEVLMFSDSTVSESITSRCRTDRAMIPLPGRGVLAGEQYIEDATCSRYWRRIVEQVAPRGDVHVDLDDVKTARKVRRPAGARVQRQRPDGRGSVILLEMDVGSITGSALAAYRSRVLEPGSGLVQILFGPEATIAISRRADRSPLLAFRLALVGAWAACFGLDG